MPAGEIVNVTVPNGAQPGQLLMVTTPSGSTAHVNIPDGLTPGQTFAVQVPLTQLIGTSQTVVGIPVETSSAQEANQKCEG